MQYDRPFEVTKSQYEKVMNHCKGIVAGRISDDRYFIKLWLMSHRNYVQRVLNSIK